jgi:hypothetical protein
MHDEETRVGAPEAKHPWDVRRSLRWDEGRDGETPNNCIVRADPRFPERTGKRA